MLEFDPAEGGTLESLHTEVVTGTQARKDRLSMCLVERNENTFRISQHDWWPAEDAFRALYRTTVWTSSESGTDVVESFRRVCATNSASLVLFQHDRSRPGIDCELRSVGRYAPERSSKAYYMARSTAPAEPQNNLWRIIVSSPALQTGLLAPSLMASFPQ
jgi:hypothetical protein